MPRPTRKKLKFTEESLNDFLQEIYDDSHNIKAKITRLFTKWEQKVKEGGEIAALGDSIVKLINAESKNQDQKIMLLKYLKDIVYQNTTASGIVGESEGQKKEVDSNRRNELLKMVQDEYEKRGK